MNVISKGIKYRNWEILHPASAQNTLEKGLSFLRKLLTSIFIVIYLVFVLAFFSATQNFADQIFVIVWSNLRVILLNITAYLPKLLFIVITTFITLQIIKLFRSFMAQVESGKMKFKMFPAEYAAPTRQIFSFGIVVFAAVIITPYLPGSGSHAFKGVTVFLGILVSLGSTTAIANIVASFVIQYMQAFKVGDIIKVGNNTGTITSINLFSTRMVTLSNEYISIPNGLVLSSSLTNYSRNNTSAVEVGVSIGYDVPWRDVHNALLESTHAVDGVVQHPEPFVLQKSLDDFYVSYKLYAFVDKARARPLIISRLNEMIRDVFLEKNIEILSPSHTELRGKTEIIDAVIHPEGQTDLSN